MIKFQFHHWDKLLSKAIRLFSGGFFNHVSIQMGDYIYEAHINTWVRKIARIDWEDETVYTFYEYYLWPKREKMVEDWLEKQVGKKYDTLGVLSFLWRFIPQSPWKFYCSELAFIAFMKLHKITKENYNAKKTPQDFFELLYIRNHSSF